MASSLFFQLGAFHGPTVLSSLLMDQPWDELTEHARKLVLSCLDGTVAPGSRPGPHTANPSTEAVEHGARYHRWLTSICEEATPHAHTVHAQVSCGLEMAGAAAGTRASAPHFCQRGKGPEQGYLIQDVIIDCYHTIHGWLKLRFLSLGLWLAGGQLVVCQDRGGHASQTGACARDALLLVGACTTGTPDNHKSRALVPLGASVVKAAQGPDNGLGTGDFSVVHQGREMSGAHTVVQLAPRPHDPCRTWSSWGFGKYDRGLPEGLEVGQ